MTKTFLCNDTGDIAEYISSVRAKLFGELLKTATPLVEHYHSDFYHDAIWVHEHVSGPMQFFFGADVSGTAIGTSLGYVSMSRKTVWHVVLTRSAKRVWEVEVSEVPEYTRACAQAATSQGLDPVMEALTAAGLVPELNQTGGYTMVVTVAAPEGTYGITAEDDGDGFYLVFYPGDSWTEGPREDDNLLEQRGNIPLDELVAVVRSGVQS